MDKFINFLGLIKKSGNLIEGYNKCEELIKKGKIKLIILSEDLSLNSKEKFEKYCERYGVPYIQNYSKNELGKVLGRSEISILGITDENLKNKLIANYEEVKNKNKTEKFGGEV